MAINDATLTSLRERKKARTRRELIDVALDLFLRQGFEQSTLEQIAEEAELSISTVLRYFNSKSRLALAINHDLLDQFRARLEAPDREIDTLSCWRGHVEDTVRSMNDTPKAAALLKMVMSEPALVAGLLEVRQGYEDAIAVALVLDATPTLMPDVHARMLAAMLVAGNAAVFRAWVAGGQREDIRVNLLAAVDFAIDNFPPIRVAKPDAQSREGSVEGAVTR